VWPQPLLSGSGHMWPAPGHAARRIDQAAGAGPPPPLAGRRRCRVPPAPRRATRRDLRRPPEWRPVAAEHAARDHVIAAGLRITADMRRLELSRPAEAPVRNLASYQLRRAGGRHGARSVPGE